MPATKPDLRIDAEGVCSACRAYERRGVRFVLPCGERTKPPMPDPARREGGERLLRCPFCGANPEIRRVDTQVYGPLVEVVCSTPNCPASEISTGDNRDDTADWQRRVSCPHDAAWKARLREAARDARLADRFVTIAAWSDDSDPTERGRLNEVAVAKWAVFERILNKGGEQ